MPRKDIYHNTVVIALTTDGWTITDDPLSYGDRNVYADLGAERLISAKKGIQKIVVEIKSFIGISEIHELEIAIGQYNLYRDILSEVEPERILYLVPERKPFFFTKREAKNIVCSIIFSQKTKFRNGYEIRVVFVFSRLRGYSIQPLRGFPQFSPGAIHVQPLLG